MRKRELNGKSLVEVAVDEIIQLILDNGMKPGDKLANEYELAQQLGIGRSTLREATRRLVARNILQVRQGSGTFVSDKNGVPEDPLGLTFMGNDPKLAIELLDIRLMLEPEIAQMVARSASPMQIQQLYNYCQKIVELADSGQDYSAADAQFHRFLAECSGNEVLRNLIPIIASSVNVVIATTNDENRKQSIQQHKQIVDAIARRDPMGARFDMIHHLNTNRESILRHLDESKKANPLFFNLL
ncbi:MAG: FadR/GntR family transcriptional regulator [Lawsonibacter sp.]|nr:FadR/GntR family transcriptional regulator [Lawsonibacter sp.]